MKIKRDKLKFYYVGGDLNLHEVRRVYTKIASIIGLASLMAVAVIIGVNQNTVNSILMGRH